MIENICRCGLSWRRPDSCSTLLIDMSIAMSPLQCQHSLYNNSIHRRLWQSRLPKCVLELLAAFWSCTIYHCKALLDLPIWASASVFYLIQEQKLHNLSVRACSKDFFNILTRQIVKSQMTEMWNWKINVNAHSFSVLREWQLPGHHDLPVENICFWAIPHKGYLFFKRSLFREGNHLQLNVSEVVFKISCTKIKMWGKNIPLILKEYTRICISMLMMRNLYVARFKFVTLSATWLEVKWVHFTTLSRLFIPVPCYSLDCNHVREKR